MIQGSEIALIIGLAVIFALLVIIVVALLYTKPQTTYERSRKASLPPLHGGYRALPPGQGRDPHPSPPKAPKGSGGGSH